MESLNDTKWDVLISGTGLAQSLLALSLSRSGKKILHVDRYNIYGGPEAALSLQDAETWRDDVNTASHDSLYPFESVEIIQHPQPESSSTKSRLGSSRSYSLSLSPQLIYTQSKLIPLLVSSHVYHTLEFLAVGSWWVADDRHEGNGVSSADESPVVLKKIPNGREDIFADDSLNVRSKRALMKFLRHVLQGETEETPIAEEQPSVSFAQALKDNFHIPESLHQPLLALSLSPENPVETPSSFAMERINRHMTSIGVFGPGFGSLIVKWGGLSEIAQASCRALAVGGGVYVLGRQIKSMRQLERTDPSIDTAPRLAVEFSNGETIETSCAIGGLSDLPAGVLNSTEHQLRRSAQAIYIVSSPLEQLFSTNTDGGPSPAGIVVNFPGDTHPSTEGVTRSPTYLLVHSSDTGECPNGQCIIYASCAFPSDESVHVADHIHTQLDLAVEKLLDFVANSAGVEEEHERPTILWSMHYNLRGLSPLLTSMEKDSLQSAVISRSKLSNIVAFPPSSLDLAFDDSTIEHVRTAWEWIMGDDTQGVDFLRFESRENMVDE